MKILSVDIGTSGLRSAIYTQDLKCLGSKSVRTQLYRADGGIVETDVDEIFDNFITTARGVIAEVSKTHNIDDLSLISYSVQGEAVIAVDHKGNPKGLAPVSMDERGKELAKSFSQEMTTDQFREITGQPLHPMFSIFKIAVTPKWQDMEIGEFFLPMDAYISLKLGAKPYVDITSAARFGLLNADTGQWDHDLATRFGISVHTLPPIAYPGEKVGVVSKEWKETLGLSVENEVVITAGAHDQACAFWGSGGRCDGVVTYSLGSTDCFTQGSTSRPSLPANSGLATYKAFDNLWITLAGTAASGWSLEWLDKVLNNTQTSDVGAMSENMSDKPSELLVLPYHAGSGTLDNNPNARGVILGLGLDTTRGDIIRAFLEASGYEVAKIVQATKDSFAPIRVVNAVGGGACDSDVMQLRADSSNLVLQRLGYDAALRGAAIQALVGAGLLSDYTEATPVAKQEEVSPRPEYVDHYDKQRDKYIRAYSNLLNLEN